MTQVHTAPFLLVRHAPSAVRRSSEAVRLDARLHRCQALFAVAVSSVVALLAYEIHLASTLGIPFIPLR